MISRDLAVPPLSLRLPTGAPARPPDGRNRLLTWTGLGCGIVCLACSTTAAGEHHRLYGAMPDPAQITAYVAALSGAVLTVANMLFHLWDLVQARRHPRRRRREHEHEHEHGPGDVPGARDADHPAKPGA
jgi:hypothetical protein